MLLQSQLERLFKREIFFFFLVWGLLSGVFLKGTQYDSISNVKFFVILQTLTTASGVYITIFYSNTYNIYKTM